MDISARTDYAVRALLTLAAAQRDGEVSSDEPHTAAVSVDVLVREQGLPRKFLEAILADLRRGGLVTSRRGPGGGYALARPADQIFLGDVFRTVDGPLAEVRGLRPHETAYTGRRSTCRWCGSRCAPACGGSSTSARSPTSSTGGSHTTSWTLPPHPTPGATANDRRHPHRKVSGFGQVSQAIGRSEPLTWNAPASMRWSAGRGRVSTRRRRLHAISIARARDPGSVGGGRGGRRPHGGRGRCGSHRRQVGGLRAGQEGPELVAAAVAQGKPTVTLIVSTASGANSRVEAAIKGLGGTIGYREDSIGYLRAVVPTGKAGSVAGIAGVDGVDVDDVIPLDDPAPGPNGQIRPAP